MSYLGSKAFSMAGGVLRGLVFERYKSKIAAGIETALSGIGEEKVRFIVENDMSLWEFWPDKEKAVAWLEPYRDIIGKVNLSEVTDEVLKILAETDSRFAFIPKEWLLKTLREARLLVVKNMLK